MLLTAHNASRKASITAAEELRPPIGSEPSITPRRPAESVYALFSAHVAPRR